MHTLGAGCNPRPDLDICVSAGGYYDGLSSDSPTILRMNRLFIVGRVAATMLVSSPGIETSLPERPSSSGTRCHNCSAFASLTGFG